jgi:hypothetical protein
MYNSPPERLFLDLKRYLSTGQKVGGPNSPDYKKILSAIFSQSPKKFEDIAWDIDSHAVPAAYCPVVVMLGSGE